MFRLWKSWTEILSGRIPCAKGNNTISLRFKSLSHYEVLGVSKDASQQEIKDAFVKKSKQLHPDVNKTDPQTHEKFVRVSEAYNVLGKASSRQEYDNSSGLYDMNSSPGNQYPHESPFSYHASQQMFRDHQFWAQQHQRAPPPPPPYFTEEMMKAKAEQRKRTKSFLVKLLLVVIVIQFIRAIVFVHTHRNLTQAYRHDSVAKGRYPKDGELGYVKKTDR